MSTYYSISELQQLSGIKAHTIRIWEQRYQALAPDRSEGNTRYYNESQLKRLLNITSLMNQEHKVSELCSMSDDQLFHLVREKLSQPQQDAPGHYEHFISQMILSALKFDEALFEKLFSGCLLRYGMKETYLEVIYPLMIRMGLMWASDSLTPASEHFVTNIIRQKFLAATDVLPPAAPNSKTWMLFLPEQEYHEIGLLFAQYMLKLHQIKVIYLGSNVPLSSVQKTLDATHPHALYFFLIHHNLPESLEDYLKAISGQIKNTRIFISGNGNLLKKMKPRKEVTWIKDLSGLEQAIQSYQTNPKN